MHTASLIALASAIVGSI